MADNYSISLDGVDDIIDIGSITSSDDLCLDGTDMSMWFKVRPAWSGDTYQRLLEKATGGSGAGGYSLQLVPSSDEIDFWVGSSKKVSYNNSSIGVWAADTWIGLGITYNNTTGEWKVYLNGHLMSTTTNSTTFSTTTANAHFGRRKDNSTNELDGLLSEMRVYNKVLTQAEIHELEYTVDRTSLVQTGIILEWLCEDGSGTTSTDETTSWDGTLTNGPTWSTTVAPLFEHNPPAVGGTSPKGPMGHPFNGPFAGPLS